VTPPDPADTTESPLLELRDVVVEYRGGVRAVAGVDLSVNRGETLSIVGESGCGKSSLARAIVHAPPPTGGEVVFDGVSLGSLSTAQVRRLRPRFQMIFQDPISSLNPRRTARQLVAEGADVWRRREPARAAAVDVDDLLRRVGIDPVRLGDRRPHEFSGGQCQRISIARAIAMQPELLVCDEPVSALDVSVQAQVLNLLRALSRDLGLTLVFIAHDLAVVRNISHRVAVMYLGRIVEVGDVLSVYERPAHHYTAGLLAAVPDIDAAESEHLGDVAPISGDVPSPANPPSGCRFRTRCPHATDRCADEVPELRPVGDDGQLVACHYPRRAPEG